MTHRGQMLDSASLRSRRAALGVIIFLSTLPLQWQVLAPTPVGQVRYFHLGALMMIAIARPEITQVRVLLRKASPATAAMVVLTIFAVLTALIHGGLWANPIQHAAYFVVGVVFATALFIALSHPAGKARLVWAAPVAVITFLIIFSRTLQTAGIDPVETFQRAISSGDPDVIIFGLFRAAFATSDQDEVRANIRHEIFAALLVAVYTTCLAKKVSARAAVIAGTGVIAAVVLVMVSLSRASTLAAMLVVIAVATRVVLRNFLSRGTLAVFGALLIASLLTGPRFANLLYRRFFEDTGSYESRLDTYAYSNVDLFQRVLLGGPELEVSTHVMATDMLLRGGFVAGMAALILMVIFVGRTATAFTRYLEDLSLANLSAFGAGALVVVRSMTAGGGYLGQVEWAAFGVLVAVAMSAANSSRTAEAEPTVSPTIASNP